MPLSGSRKRHDQNCTARCPTSMAGIPTTNGHYLGVPLWVAGCHRVDRFTNSPQLLTGIAMAGHFTGPNGGIQYCQRVVFKRGSRGNSCAFISDYAISIYHQQLAIHWLASPPGSHEFIYSRNFHSINLDSTGSDIVFFFLMLPVGVSGSTISLNNFKHCCLLFGFFRADHWVSGSPGISSGFRAGSGNLSPNQHL